MKKISVLIVGHGSRDKSANREFERLVKQYQARHPQWIISRAYLELAKPSFLEALEKLAVFSEYIVVLPLLLFAGKHVRQDIPEVIQSIKAKFPNVRIERVKTLGTSRGLLDVMDGNIKETKRMKG